MAAATVPVEVRRDEGGAVAAAVQRAIREHGEIGIQVSAIRDGELLIDVAGGIADLGSRQPVTPSSLFPVFSVTKAVVAALALRLAGQGIVTLDAPIADVWPEFAAAGKGAVTLEHALTHSAGIPQMPAGVTPQVMCDWDEMCRRIARLEPLWRPGERTGYHSYTYGWIVGETLRRALGSTATVGELTRELIAGPSGAPDFWIGTPAVQHPRIVTLYKEPRPAGSGASLAERAIPPSLAAGQDVFGRPDVRESCHPAAGGTTTARSLAAIFAMLAADGRAGRAEVIASAWVAAAARARRDETDVVLGARIARGLGCYVSAAANHEQGPPFESGQHVLGHPGSGGSVAWADRDLRAGFALTRNRMTTAGWNDPVVRTLVRTVRAAVAG
jgi:CubicO group peptidase (beta-lactamase class C family)